MTDTTLPIWWSSSEDPQTAEKLLGVLVGFHTMNASCLDATRADWVAFHEHELAVLEEIAADPPADIADQIEDCAGMARFAIWELHATSSDEPGGGD
jgi:hypothetical protein